MTITLIPVFLAAIGTLGVIMIVGSLVLPRSTFNRIQRTPSGPRLAGRFDDTWISSLLVDLSRRINPEEGNLEQRLSRSGWLYQSAEEFHTRRMLLTLTYLTLGVGVSILLTPLLKPRLPSISWAMLGTLGTQYGFLLPNRALSRAIQRRNERLVKEMGFGLERIALLLQSGADIAEALQAAGNLGLFGSACRRLASGISTGRSVVELGEELQEEMPRSPQFDEFLGMLIVSIQKGSSLVEPFQARARAARQLLKLNIIEAGHKAKIKVALLTSMVILLASIIVTVLPTLLLLMEEGML